MYNIILFKFDCAIVTKPTNKTLPNPSHSKYGLQAIAPSGSNGAAIWISPYKPNFLRTPACNIETEVGAVSYPFAAQVWNGNNATRIPKPIKSRPKILVWVDSSKFVFASADESEGKSNFSASINTLRATNPPKEINAPKVR